jgi:branched-chain amino acid transport system substrate-binding protein
MKPSAGETAQGLLATESFYWNLNDAAMGVAQAKSDATAVVRTMKAVPFDDDAFGRGTICNDGRALQPAYLFQVKMPTESNGPWDYYGQLSTIPGDEAAAPLAEEHCPIAPT